MAQSVPPSEVVDAAADDVVLPFAIEGLDVRGRVARLGPAVDTVLARHGYPAPVAALLAEAMALTVLLGSAFKIDGRFILQTQSDGPVGLMVIDFAMPDRIRAYASYDPARIAEGESGDAAAQRRLLGEGHLAMTVDPGPQANRYQGVVPLDGRSLEDAAHVYFHQSEQIPTRVRLAAARAFRGGEAGDRDMHWRAGGIVIQHLPEAGPARASDEEETADEWTEARLLLDTVEPHELTDPSITLGELLMRLYHERGVRVFEPTGLKEACGCSRARIVAMLQRFSPDERAEMPENGRIEVTCEFCSTRYHIDPAELD